MLLSSPRDNYSLTAIIKKPRYHNGFRGFSFAENLLLVQIWCKFILAWVSVQVKQHKNTPISIEDKLKAVVGGAWVHPNIVFTSEIGNYYCRSFTNKQLKKVLVENDMPSLSVHGLRHSNASLLINNGYDVKAISEHLGHCNT